jgi:hypothetical protein
MSESGQDVTLAEASSAVRFLSFNGLARPIALADQHQRGRMLDRIRPRRDGPRAIGTVLSRSATGDGAPTGFRMAQGNDLA